MTYNRQACSVDIYSLILCDEIKIMVKILEKIIREEGNIEIIILVFKC